MGFVKRKVNTEVKVLVEDFEKLKSQFLFDIDTFTSLEEIPESLVFNWDQSALKYVPVPDWTMDKKGNKKVKLAGLDDKRQITAMFAATMTGDFLPPQLVYKGTTRTCLLTNKKFPDSWHVTYTYNYWCNEETVKLYAEKVIVPYIQRTKDELQYRSFITSLLHACTRMAPHSIWRVKISLKLVHTVFGPIIPHISRLILVD